MDFLDDLIDPADPDKVLLTMHPRPVRRVAGVLAIGGLGVLMIWLAAQSHTSLGLRGLLFGTGIACLGFVAYLWRVTDTVLELTALELREAGGRRLFRVEDVIRVERGVFAFKPSNGFSVRTREPGPRTYVPGVWWRFGRLVGVGGLTSGAEGKAMADMLMVLAKRPRQ